MWRFYFELFHPWLLSNSVMHNVLSLITPDFYTLFACLDCITVPRHYVCMSVMFPGSFHSHIEHLSHPSCVYLSPLEWGGGVPKPYSNPAWEKALEKNSWTPTWESVGRRTSNTLENVRAIFSCLIILKCSGWLRTSTVNYAHYTSELL